MNCERAKTLIIDGLTGEVDPSVETLLGEHLARCPDCAREAAAFRDVWSALDGDEGPAPVPEAVPRFRARLQDLERRIGREAVAGSARAVRRRTAVWLGAVAAAAVLGVALGWTVRGSTGVTVQPTAEAEEYLFLLHEGSEDRADLPDETLVYREYSAWARRLEEAGRLLGAERLADEAVWLSRTTVESTPPISTAGSGSLVSGYFLVTAADRATAIALARESPHVRYGGWIEIRRIVHGSP